MTTLEKILEKRKLTYMNEEQQATLYIFCDMYWDDVNDETLIFNQDNIINILQHYVDTGGSVAGGYIQCVPNIIDFVNTHYNFFLAIHLQLTSKGLYKGDLLEFLLTQYREFIFQTEHD